MFIRSSLSSLSRLFALLTLTVGLSACSSGADKPQRTLDVAGKKVVESVPEDALKVVVALDEALAMQEHPKAQALFDFEYRLQEVLGDLWAQGSPEDRADMIRLSWDMFLKTYESSKRFLEGKSMEYELLSREQDTLWVQSAPVGAAKTFHWRYRLMRKGDTWLITQREFSQSGGQSDTTRFWVVAQQHLAKEYGRPVTLRELIANLPKTDGILRARVFQVPDNLPRRMEGERRHRRALKAE